ncbi:MAG: WG repeat-containing protein [Bacteroidaceae bacterium]|nr:WG repeat-containing protein [Bacteroidaceae bacterium]
MKRLFCLLACCACVGAALSQTPARVMGAAKPATSTGPRQATTTPTTGSGQATTAKAADATNLPSPAEEGLAGEGVDLGKWKGIKPMQMSTDEIEWRLSAITKSPQLKQIVINEYESDYEFRDGMLAVCNTELGRYAFYDEDGNQLPGGFKWSKPLPMSREFSFGADHCIVFEHVRTPSGFHNYICYIIDKKGQTKRLPAGDNSSTVWPFNNGGIAAVETSGRYVSFFNTRGEQVLKGIHAEEHEKPIGDFIDGWARVYAGIGGEQKGYTFVNKLGKTIGKYYKHAQEFSEGLAAVCVETDNGMRWGFIDATGKMVIEPRFSNEPTPFSCGYSVATKQNENMVYIDKQGNVCGEETKWLTRFVGGKAFGSDGDTKSWIIDTNLQRTEITQAKYGWWLTHNISYLSRFPLRMVFGDRYVMRHEGPYGGYSESYLVDIVTGRNYVMSTFSSGMNACTFDHITPHRIHVAWTDENKKKHDGFLNENGELILEFVSDEF